MKYEWFIGLRYLKARRQETFISLITVISILGVMIGVMIFNVVMAVMTGFEEILRDRLLGINAHVAVVKSGDQLRDYERLLSLVLKENGVVAASPTIYGQVMLTSGPRVSGVVVRGRRRPASSAAGRPSRRRASRKAPRWSARPAWRTPRAAATRPPPCTCPWCRPATPPSRCSRHNRSSRRRRSGPRRRRSGP